MLTIDYAGERLKLSAERALHWPQQKTLLIADPHFGKGATFRRAGVNLPAGGSERDLDRLARLIAATNSERLLVLGDFCHASLHPDEPFVAALRRFCRRHSNLDIAVIRGNHDRWLDPDLLPATVRWLNEGETDPPFVYRHHPLSERDSTAKTIPAAHRVLAGHIHPVRTLRGPGGDRLRLPVYWFGARQAVLPAFGLFTGGFEVRSRPLSNERLYGVLPNGEGVVAI